MLAITGMRDNACRERVCEVLEEITGVAHVSVSLIRARAIVEHGPECDPAALVQTVAEAGYGAVVDGRGRSG